MKNFENNLRNDTVLNTGLLAIAIAWVAFAAIRGPAAVDGTAAYLAPPAAVQVPAVGVERALALPAAGARADRQQV